MSVWVFSCLVALCWLAAPVSTAAQDLMVLAFTGTGAERARDEVVAALADEMSVARAEDIYRRARIRGIATREAAREAGVAIFVRGTVGRRVTLVAEDAEGHVLTRGVAPVPRNRHATAELRRKTRLLARRAKRGLSSPSRAREATDAAPAGAVPADREASVEAPTPDTGRPVLDARLGVGVRSRDADVALASGARRRFRSGLFPELLATIETRPLRGSGRWASGFIARAGGSLGVGLTTLDENENVLSTTVFGVGVELGYLLPLHFAEIGLFLGLGYDAFQLPVDSRLFPSADYFLGRVALAGRVPLVGRLLALDVEAAARFVLDTGGLTSRFGQTSSAIGFDVRAGIRGETEVGFTYGLHLGLRRYGMVFGGVPSDAADEGVEGVDMSFVAQVTLGFRITE